MSLNIALLRHGRTAWNRAGKLQGRADMPLDAEGRAEALEYAPPDDWRDATLISSPLRRAKDTAEAVWGRPPELDARLIELDLGAWEGRRGVDLLVEPGSGYRHVEDWGWGFHPPQGEPLTALRDRLAALFADLATAAPTGGAHLALVAHINVMRVALAWAHGWGFEGAPPFQIKRYRLYRLNLAPDGAPSPAGEPLRLPRRRSAPPPEPADT